MSAISNCRVCGNANLVKVLDLGEQAMTGIFPKSRDEVVATGPLQLVKCVGETSDQCGLVQLAHDFDLSMMYGENYGYRSGLNASMVRHLGVKVERILSMAPLRDGDLVIDIGSNDGTTLGFYPARFDRLGVDPTGAKFRQFYAQDVDLIPDFFSAERVREHLGDRRARVITSFSMFYDLPAPLNFMREVLQVLEDDGIWVLEQSYMPTMLAANSYDTVCHEHVEYYGLSQIKWMADRSNAKIVDVEFNDVNGGSFSVTIAKQGAPQPEFANLGTLLAHETDAGLDGLEPLRAFEARVKQSRTDLRSFVQKAKEDGRRVYGLGASTKGNVLLQYCGFTSDDIVGIGEVNADKFGSYTPGSLIPILPEADVLALRPDHLLVLPWHFRHFFEQSPVFAGQPLVFPLPYLSWGATERAP